MDLVGLIEKTEQAFKGIPRGAIGIREAAAMDDRAEEPELSNARKNDLETDWRDIPDEVLKKCQDVLPYLDDPGFKFLTPAIMRWSLKRRNFDEILVEFLFYRLVAETRREDQHPQALVKKYGLNGEQIQVIVLWLDTYISFKGRFLKELELQQMERWKKLSL